MASENGTSADITKEMRVKINRQLHYAYCKSLDKALSDGEFTFLSFADWKNCPEGWSEKKKILRKLKKN